MNKLAKILLIIVLCLVATVASAAGEKQTAFSAFVDSKGSINLPKDFRSTWVHLGTWLVTSTAAAGPVISQTGPGMGIHTVYTQPASLNAYKKNNRWPDGSMLVMEIRALQWDDLPTGHVIVEGEPIKWLVMVKDAKGRFPKNPNWGDGWGWALFNSTDVKNNISTNYKNDCLSCHEPAKATDLVFLKGYPTLR